MDYNELRKRLISFYDEYSELSDGYYQSNYSTFEAAMQSIYESDNLVLVGIIRNFKQLFRCTNEDFNSVDISVVSHFWAKEMFYVASKDFKDRFMIGISLKLSHNRYGFSVVKYDKELDAWSVVYGKSCDIQKHSIEAKYNNPLKNIM